MNEKKGLLFEKLTQQIFQEILNQDLVRNIVVRHDVRLKGKATSHQIDIFWEFEFGSVIYKTIVEVKDWKEALNQGEVMKFKAVLDDLPDQPRGIIVSRVGFQSGAREFAAANGILLFELREPNDEDLKGRVQSIILTLTTYHARTSGIRLLHDEEWRISEARRLGLPEAPRLSLRLEPIEAQLVDHHGNKLRSVKDVIDDLYPRGARELVPTQARYDFRKPTFLVTNNSMFPKLKLSGLEAMITVTALEQDIVVDAKEFVRYILKETLTSEVQAFDHQLHLRPE
ncbi:MAG: restriction endonuclease [Pyrinomonadaceae bacterium]